MRKIDIFEASFELGVWVVALPSATLGTTDGGASRMAIPRVALFEQPYSRRVRGAVLGLR